MYIFNIVFRSDHALRGKLRERPWGVQKHVWALKTKELLKCQHCIKIVSFNVWVRYFVWNFKGTLWNSTQNISPIHWTMRILYTDENLRAIRFKSSYTFLKRPHISLVRCSVPPTIRAALYDVCPQTCSLMLTDIHVCCSRFWSYHTLKNSAVMINIFWATLYILTKNAADQCVDKVLLECVDRSRCSFNVGFWRTSNNR